MRGKLWRKMNGSSSHLHAIRDFEEFLNTSISNDISAEIETIIRSATASQPPSSTKPASLVSTGFSVGERPLFRPRHQRFGLGADTSFDGSFDGGGGMGLDGSERLTAGDKVDGLTLHRKDSVSADAPNLDQIEARLQSMQKQIDNLALTSTPTKPSSEKQEDLGLFFASKLDDVWSELASLKEKVDSQQVQMANVSPVVKAYVKREVKKRDEAIISQFLKPEIERQFAVLDAKFVERIDNIATSALHPRARPPLTPPAHTYSQNAYSSKFYTSTSKPLAYHASSATTAKTSNKIHTEPILDNPSFLETESELDSRNLTAEEELQELMARLKADLAKRVGPTGQSTTPSKLEPQWHHSPHGKMTPSKAPPQLPTKQSVKKAGSESKQTYARPTYSSKLKSKAAVWK
ncbi:hypothetical protein BC830DRAFT_532464 [Chytriomyces sp. MP71]|nr:hypothetical protein BC830DRAFT_532464 [Chytriomyces sp. MP71]